jgi:hypothetical protein
MPVVLVLVLLSSVVVLLVLRGREALNPVYVREQVTLTCSRIFL